MAGTITALKAQQRAQDRVNVHLDGEFAFGLALIHAVWLKVGQQLSDSEIAKLKAADTLEQATQRALNFVAYRPRTVLEVRRRLKKAGADDEAIEGIVQRLKDAGLLSDQSFSEQWVDSRLRSKPRSKKMLAWELKQKGVDPKTVQTSLKDVDDEASALQAARGRLPRIINLEPQERKRKLVDFLARNGYSFDVIKGVVKTVLKDGIDEWESNSSSE
jgi:regulatory protein